MAGKNLEEALLEAAEIAKKLPENLQEAGFNRALDHLLGKGGSKTGGQSRSVPRKKKAATQDDDERGDETRLVDAIDRTAHPDVGETSRIADRALKVLQLARQHHGVDGLTSEQITTILTQKFRLPTRRISVIRALEREVDTVDIRKGPGNSRVFHIMVPGDEYLDRVRAGEETGRRRRRTGRSVASRKRTASPQKKAAKTTSKKKAAKKAAKTTSKKKAAKKAAKTTSKKKAAKNTAGRSSSRPGPKVAIDQLIQDGYFSSARIISEVQVHLRDKRGHGYSIQELSPTLLRCVRDESLTRKRTDKGQYEYSKD